MPRIRPLTEAGRRRERDARRDSAFRAAIGAYKAEHNRTLKEIADGSDMVYRTLLSRISDPQAMTVGEIRRLIDQMPGSGRIFAEVIGA